METAINAPADVGNNREAPRRQLDTLRKRDPLYKVTGAAVLAGEGLTNAAFVAMNRPPMVTGGSASEMFGVTGSVKETINSSFGMFNDAVGTLKDLAGIWGAALRRQRRGPQNGSRDASGLCDQRICAGASGQAVQAPSPRPRSRRVALDVDRNPIAPE